MEGTKKNKEGLLTSIEEERNIYLNKIKNALYTEKYEKILNLIEDKSKNISSNEITRLTEDIKDYIKKNEIEPLNKIKNIILEYNKTFQNKILKVHSNNPKINENIFIYQILIETNDIIGCHVYYFVSKIFEYCNLSYYKDQYISMKNDLLKCIQSLTEEYLKIKKENEIDDKLSKEEKEKK